MTFANNAGSAGLVIYTVFRTKGFRNSYTGNCQLGPPNLCFKNICRRDIWTSRGEKTSLTISDIGDAIYAERGEEIRSLAASENRTRWERNQQDDIGGGRLRMLYRVLLYSHNILRHHYQQLRYSFLCVDRRFLETDGC